jgi:acyl-CoA thioesterase-2
LLTLERLETTCSAARAATSAPSTCSAARCSGQALSAAQQTVEAGRSVHSLHAYFLRAGDITAPIIFDVDRARDGHSFSVRRVTAIQHGQPILVFASSFQKAEPGVEHQFNMPEVPQPEDVEPTVAPARK